MGGIATRRDDPTGPHGSLLSHRASYLDIDTIVLSVLIRSLKHGFTHRRQRIDLLLEGSGVSFRETQTCLKTSALWRPSGFSTSNAYSVSLRESITIRLTISPSFMTVCFRDQAEDSAFSNAFASCKSFVSNPSVNQL